MSSNGVVALVMAAGFSRRFGIEDKRLARLPDGQTLLGACVAQASAHFPWVRVALREDDVVDALGLPAHSDTIAIANAQGGLGSSLGDAMTTLLTDDRLAHARAVAILLGDMPYLAPETLVALTQRATAEIIVRPCLAGRPGHPVLFGRALWPTLAALRGENGAREVIRAHPERYRELAVTDDGILTDIDTPDALAALSQ
ncbi:nucleotidyltransferase family protein [Halomonas dongshanensis]|uniref:Nucleotidyltransferase family protein n=1 Tax=Halomonas dongshanensis TaxID=2890835 RepID=A0ABT2E8Q1_9GAMM|nr:nucleotidyltransferase family protein [Halomonas dongshanensis]MCS2607943.1 nucleotidyltransferase family protein [Halomonas dongshanensis]